jgi:hypothetical protein
MTSPNRQLTTELNFKYNPANLNKFINGVRTFNLNSLAAAGAIGALGAAVYETVNRVIDIGNNTIKIKDIAEAAGFAASEFSQFRDAAAKAGISTENFDSDFKKLSATIQQARIGTGELFRIFRESGGKIRLPDNLLTDAENFKLIFKDIFDYINSIPSETRKIQVLSNIFSPESAVRWRDAIAEGFDSFQKAAEATKQQNADLDAQTEKFKELSKAIGEFSSVAAASQLNLLLL